MASDQAEAPHHTYWKAFDSVDRANMFTILKAYGIPDKILQLIKSVYDQTVFNKTNSNYRAVQSAGRQPSRRYSCTLPVHHHSGLHPPQGFFKDNDELGFTVTPGKGRRSCNKDQEIFRLIQGTSAEAGLYVNAKKTQFMTANIPAPNSIKARDGTLLMELRCQIKNIYQQRRFRNFFIKS